MIASLDLDFSKQLNIDYVCILGRKKRGLSLLKDLLKP